MNKKQWERGQTNGIYTEVANPRRYWDVMVEGVLTLGCLSLPFELHGEKPSDCVYVKKYLRGLC